MPPESAVLGFARTQLSQENFRSGAREAVEKYSRLKIEGPCWSAFTDGLYYQSGLDQPEGFQRLRERLEQIERERNIPATIASRAWRRRD